MKGKVISYISRRNLFKFGATAVGTGLVTSKLGIDLLDAPSAEAKQNITPDNAIEQLMQGNKRFASQKTKQPNRGSFRLREIGSILEQIKPALATSKGQAGDTLKNVTVANIKAQIAVLKTSPVIADLIKTGKLKIIGGFYDLDTGLVTPVA
jgi:carbonic anhydrase